MAGTPCREWGPSMEKTQTLTSQIHDKILEMVIDAGP